MFPIYQRPAQTLCDGDHRNAVLTEARLRHRGETCRPLTPIAGANDSEHGRATTEKGSEAASSWTLKV